jgi:hypothetical protein
MLCLLFDLSMDLLLLSMLDSITLPHLRGGSQSCGLRVVLLVVLRGVLPGSVLMGGVLFGGELLVLLNGGSSRGCWLFWRLGFECSSPQLPTLVLPIASCGDVQRPENLTVARVFRSLVTM